MNIGHDILRLVVAKLLCRAVCFTAIGIWFAVSGFAQSGPYRLEASVHGPAVQVDGNTQIKLTISGLKLSDLTETPLDGLDPGRELLLSAYIGYSPKTPGLKKIGPFALELQGERLRSDVVLVEAVPGWGGGEVGYQFQVFPRKILKGEPIQVTFRQRYSGMPLVDTQSRSLQSTVRVTRKPNGEQVIKAQGPPKSWTSTGSSGTQFEGKEYHTTRWCYDIPATKVGKQLITRDDLPPLPAAIVFEPVEVEVVETRDPAPPPPAHKPPRPPGPSGARLTLRMQPRTIQLGESLNLTIVLDGGKVADLAENGLPDVPRFYEWSRDISFYGDWEFTPETPGEKTYGPFAVEFQGERVVSNSQTVEVVPSWPRDAEQYEFRIFPRTVEKGFPIRVTFRQQYSAKPFFKIPDNHPRNHNPDLWRGPGTQSWLEGGRKFTREVTTFDIPATKVGKQLITRDDLPLMDAAISFVPLEVEVIEPQ